MKHLLRAARGLEDMTSDRGQVPVFATANELRSHLQEASQPGYLYRGQTTRFLCEIPDIDGALHECDSLFPVDYRFLVRGRHLERDGDVISRGREPGRNRRDRFFRYLEGCSMDGDPHLGWLREMLDDEAARGAIWYDRIKRLPGYRADVLICDFQTRLAMHALQDEYELGLHSRVNTAMWALAQHYELTTALSDWTTDIDVAIWFATRHWSSETRPTTGVGCLYRIDATILDFTLRYFHNILSELFVSQGLVPPPRFFCQGLAHIPSTAALRPSRQSGVSVYGFDQPLVLNGLQNPMVCPLDIFEFRHSSGPFENELDREYLIPPDDPFLALLENFERLEVLEPLVALSTAP